MKLIKELTAVYNAEVKSFLNFHELKCNLPGLITEEEIEVRNDLYPESVEAIFATYDNGHIFINMVIDTEFGNYFVYIVICIHRGNVRIEFNSEVLVSIKNSYSLNGVQLNEKRFNKVVAKCLPIVESFLNKLGKTKKNNPCLNDCYYKQHKDKKGECNKMYISRAEYTPEEDRMRQQIALGIEEMNKNKANH